MSSGPTPPQRTIDAPLDDDLRLMPTQAVQREMWGATEALWGTVAAAAIFFGSWWFLVSPEGTWQNKSAVIGAGVLVWLAASQIGILTVALLLGPDRLGRPIETLGFRELSWPNLLGYAALGAGAMAVIVAGYGLIAQGVGPIPEVREDLPIVWAMPRHHLGAIAAMVVLRPLAQEIFFRGFLLQGYAARIGTPLAVVASSALFGAAHIGGGPGLIITAFGMGLALSWVFVRSGSLWPSILANIVFSAVVLSTGIG